MISIYRKKILAKYEQNSWERDIYNNGVMCGAI